MKLSRIIDRMNSWPAIVTVCLIVVVGTLSVKLWPRTVPLDQCSELYRTYASFTDIHAAFIKDFRVDDSVFVDVTVLEATTDSAWDGLVSDFKIPPPSEVCLMSKEKRNVIMRRAPRENPMDTISSPSPDDCVVAISRFDRTVCVFNTMDSSQILAIITHKVKNL